MRIRFLAMLLMPLITVAQLARVEIIQIDLARPARTFTVQLTTATSASVQANLLSNGAEADTTGWTGLLWIGDATGGISIESTATEWGRMLWDITPDKMPPDGRYESVIFGRKNDRVEEWARGAMLVRGNPADDALPPDWMAGNVSWIAATNALAVAQQAHTAIGIEAQARIDLGVELRGAINALVIPPDYGARVTALEMATNTLQQAVAGLGGRVAKLESATNALQLAVTDLRRLHEYWPPYSTPAEYFTYVTNNNAITITGYNIAGGTNVRIPSYINGWPVKVIGDEAFRESDIESVHGDVVTIGDNAFRFCGALTTASFPQATTIGGSAFYGCGALTTASFPQATTIGGSAFADCAALTTASFPQATTIGGGAFADCAALTTASFPQATTICERAFVGCAALTTAPFPQATTIGDIAFGYCTSLADITLGADAANFNVSAFAYIGANPTITISNPHARGWGETFAGLAVVRPEIIADAFTLNGDTITEWPEGGGTPAYWPSDSTPSQYFSFTTNNNTITITGYDEDGGADVRIPSYINGWPVKVIGDDAFRESDIESVHGDVVTIGDRAFLSCTRLTTASFPQATTIGEWAFFDCRALATAPFPQATTIGAQAFYSCASLTTAPFPQATTIGLQAFGDCDTLTAASFPQATTIGLQAFYSCTSLADITLGTDAANFNVSTFNNINANPTITISNPHARGWGETFAGLAVVRLPLYGDKIYQAGELVATEVHVAQEIAAIPEPDLSDHPTFSQIAASNALPYSAWTTNVVSSGTNVITSAWGNQPRLELTDAGVIDFDFGTSSNGLHRLTLSLWSGTNSVAWLTNNVDFAEAPELSTNSYNTILIRKTGISKAEGRQL